MMSLNKLGTLAALGIVPFSVEIEQLPSRGIPHSVQRFARGQASHLYLPEAGHQLVAADLDRDGDEDKTQIQLLPLQAYEGKAAAAAGGSADFSVEPVRPCVLLNMKFQVAGGVVADILLTTLEVGDVNLLPAKGAAPVGPFFSTDSTDSTFESPLFGPGVALAFTLRNKHASTAATIWGAARVASIVG